MSFKVYLKNTVSCKCICKIHLSRIDLEGLLFSVEGDVNIERRT